MAFDAAAMPFAKLMGVKIILAERERIEGEDGRLVGLVTQTQMTIEAA